MRKEFSKPEIIFLVISALLITVLILQTVKINRLTGRLNDLTIIDWQSDSLRVETGLSHDIPSVLVTPEFVDQTFLNHSPFGDDYDLEKLIAEYVRYGQSDMYGSGRRTGNIRRIHEGIDLYVPENTPVFPVFPLGIVTDVSDDPDYIFYTTGYVGRTKVDSVGVEYGKIVRILYPEGIESLYAHLNEVFVEPGQIVRGDTPIGLSGYTGNIRYSGKPSHLHLELRDEEGKSFDPEKRLHYRFASLRRFIDHLMTIKQGTE